jgi:deoxyribodipyrimidine photolyase-related protein
MKAAIIYPHQLFSHNPVLENVKKVFLVEEPLFFTQFKFHQQKLVLHRAALKFYAEHLEERGFAVRYVEIAELKETKDLAGILAGEDIAEIIFLDPVDDWLENRLTAGLEEAEIEYRKKDTPMFFNSAEDIEDYFGGSKSFSMTKFYRQERKRHDILMDEDGEPVGGKLTFDTENRKKLPKDVTPPEISRPGQNEYVQEAIEYVAKNFGDNYGKAEDFAYPVTFQDAEKWLDDFLGERFAQFGDYEDAIAKEEDFVFHGVLTPMLNCGLLTPHQIIDKALSYAGEKDVPLNSLEGFVRQIIGWREFMRGIYVTIGRRQRSANFWDHQRKLPESFWTAQTGIEPLDDIISKLLKNSYNHHIERLMILGNFMILTEIDPDDAYEWFMEMYIDAYDWVMVPNVYGMSLYADGGSITTKPYISGSNYIRKMSDYGRGEWAKIWDGLYWRFIDKHKDFFKSNPRLSMMPHLLEKMDQKKRSDHFQAAEDFLAELFD